MYIYIYAYVYIYIYIYIALYIYVYINIYIYIYICKYVYLWCRFGNSRSSKFKNPLPNKNSLNNDRVEVRRYPQTTQISKNWVFFTLINGAAQGASALSGRSSHEGQRYFCAPWATRGLIFTSFWARTSHEQKLVRLCGPQK